VADALAAVEARGTYGKVVLQTRHHADRAAPASRL
jgi:hypothetical protein